MIDDFGYFWVNSNFQQHSTKMEQDYFKRTYKEDLADFNIEEIRGWVINSMNFIEEKIDNTIVKYFNPKKAHSEV